MEYHTPNHIDRPVGLFWSELLFSRVEEIYEGYECVYGSFSTRVEFERFGTCVWSDDAGAIV